MVGFELILTTILCDSSEFKIFDGVLAKILATVGAVISTT